MIISSFESLTNNRIHIDLASEEGSSLSLIYIAKNMSDQLGMNSYQIVNEMSLGTREELIQTFEKYFGEFTVLSHKI